MARCIFNANDTRMLERPIPARFAGRDRRTTDSPPDFPASPRESSCTPTGFATGFAVCSVCLAGGLCRGPPRLRTARSSIRSTGRTGAARDERHLAREGARRPAGRPTARTCSGRSAELGTRIDADRHERQAVRAVPAQSRDDERRGKGRLRRRGDRREDLGKCLQRVSHRRPGRARRLVVRRRRSARRATSTPWGCATTSSASTARPARRSGRTR